MAAKADRFLGICRGSPEDVRKAPDGLTQTRQARLDLGLHEGELVGAHRDLDWSAEAMEQPKRVIDANGQDIGVYVRCADTAKGEAALIQRAERLGGGMIVFPAHELEQRDGEWVVPWEDLSILEAPPYSPNVELEAYLDFWKMLGASDMNSSPREFMQTGSGPVGSDQDVPDAQLEETVKERLRDASDKGVDHYLVTVSVNKGTVLLAGYQGDTLARLAAAEAAASVPGVKEIVNMLVIRAV